MKTCGSEMQTSSSSSRGREESVVLMSNCGVSFLQRGFLAGDSDYAHTGQKLEDTGLGGS